MTARPRPRIGVSACIMHADPQRPLFKGKTLLYAEESMLGWVMSVGAVPMMLPRAAGQLSAGDLLDECDGLLLQGGVDMAPESYGETAARPEWAGDAERDRYECELVREALARDLPVLGICRGAQVLNVALGGTLWQDIATMHPGGRAHRDWDIYDKHAHDLAIEPGSWLARWYAGVPAPRINSVHHQGLKDLGRGLVVEARSLPDGVIEAVRYDPAAAGDAGAAAGGHAPWAYGVQWHPEFTFANRDAEAEEVLDPAVVMARFLEAVAARRSA